jgi:hypothetical protein
MGAGSRLISVRPCPAAGCTDFTNFDSQAEIYTGIRIGRLTG